MSFWANARFELLRHDVNFPLYVEVDQIFNLACPASPVHYQRDPVQTLKTSVQGAINMLGLAKRLKARIFQSSTSEVYGDPSLKYRPAWIAASAVHPILASIMISTPSPTKSRIALTFATSSRQGRIWAHCILIAVSPWSV